MGNNYYIDDSEGDVNIDNIDLIESYPHIGKFTFQNGQKAFIFYLSKYMQISRLESMNMNQTVIDEFGNKKTVKTLLEEIEEIPYTEEESEFC